MQKRYHEFAFKIFCHRVPKNFDGEDFGVSVNFGYQNILCIREEGYHVSPSKNLCPTQYRKISLRSASVFQKISFIGRFFAQGISLNSFEKLLSHSADNIRRWTLLEFERILVSKKFKQRRGEDSRFCRKILLSHGTEKTSPGNHSVLQKISGREKTFMDKRGVSRFSAEKFLSGCTEIFHWRTMWCFRKILLWKIFRQRRGGGRASRFCRIFLSNRTETKIFVKETFCFPEKFWYRKKFRDKRGYITIFSQKFYVSQCRKVS